MNPVIQDFEDRINEVEQYFQFLNDIHSEGAELSLPKKHFKRDRIKPITPMITSVMKANSFLILYNLVESTIREGILAIYRKLEEDGYTYDDINQNVKSIWAKFEFRKSFDVNSSWETYFKRNLQMIANIKEGQVIKLDRNAISISGNLNAAQIREICSMHGISRSVHRSAKGGRSLEDIKTQRNLLAHGTLAFSECGRQFDIERLNEIKKETLIFLRGILRNMKLYYDHEGYKI